jgi:hypothetical protein
MARTIPLLGEIRGIRGDEGKDAVPEGFAWDMADFIPQYLGAKLRARAPWGYYSGVLANPIDNITFAPYSAGERIIVNAGTTIYRIDPPATFNNPGTAVSLGTIRPTASPIFHRNRMVLPHFAGSQRAQTLDWNGTTYTIAELPASSFMGQLGTVFGDRVVLANSAAEPTTLAFSKPGDPMLDWNVLSKIPTSLPITGIVEQRGTLLVFHSGSVERIRGAHPPDSDSGNQFGDMLLEPLFGNVGCINARTISRWGDNVLFADARGIHMTDGSSIVNLAEEGGMSKRWADLMGDIFRRLDGVTTEWHMGGTVFRDYYILSHRNVRMGANYCFVIHIPTREWIRLGNVNSNCFGVSAGASEMLLAADMNTKRVVELSRVFAHDEDRGFPLVDGNDIPVLPYVETGWLHLPAYSRVHSLFFDYETFGFSDDPAIEVAYKLTPAMRQGEDFKVAGTLLDTGPAVKRKLRMGVRARGIALKLQAVEPVYDLRLHGIEAHIDPEESTHL